MTLRIHPLIFILVLSLTFAYLRLKAGDDPRSFQTGWALGMIDCLALLKIKW